MKSILNGKKEWKKYWDKSNNFRMFDLATIKNKNIFIHGRTDDVINIRGHRIGSEEIESIVLKIKEIYECCAISIVDKIEGHVIYLFVVSKDNKLNNHVFILYQGYGQENYIDTYLRTVPNFITLIRSVSASYNFCMNWTKVHSNVHDAEEKLKRSTRS